MLHLIAPAGFIDHLNMWRQYLISRNSFEFRPRVGGVVLDCGVCIGDVTVIFAGLVGPEGQVHAFDPIPLHNKFCALQSKLNPTLSKALIFNQMAVGKEVKKENRGTTSDGDAIAPGGLQIDNFDMTSLDGYVSSDNLAQVDFIKMDIEGAEQEALLGAENLIREFKPKLAISIYHRPDDFWSVPLQIKKINPNYKFAFGHHSPLKWESVIYAYQP
jgi:FkbM family methyltransferase